MIVYDVTLNANKLTLLNQDIDELKDVWAVEMTVNFQVTGYFLWNTSLLT